MKTAEELARSVVLKTFMGYSAKKGFMCQMHFPDFQNALAEHDKEIVEMIDDMIEKEKDITMEHTVFDIKSLKYFIKILTELKDKIKEWL